MGTSMARGGSTSSRIGSIFSSRRKGSETERGLVVTCDGGQVVGLGSIGLDDNNTIGSDVTWSSETDLDGGSTLAFIIRKTY